ncbi:NAD(P)H-quinone oxidoreductase [Phenylobacterium sp.]|uniref:NAD(P)H-quinone oxidoreductase n=1 Tax=Phenylobacterium sp. TaxID=1871053 RepID=UPI0027341EE2|nr:NAD(P)H-quinone oxidoreductase [Phenylobacterium sp.]MDP3660485.1 NAD(P)H-quinone oxidoreductase [Phenylobacterium sp.]
MSGSDADQTMRTIVIEGGKGPAEALQVAEVPRPVPADGQILIKVAAAGLNRGDVIQRLGFYPSPPGAPQTMGLEVSGVVVHGAGRWKVGDRVCALLGGGGYAEYVAVDARHALPVPADMDLVEAASLPETILTVFANVFESGALQPGQTLMLHGATSGIGVTAIQMCKIYGAKVIATARGADKAAEAHRLGAEVVVDATTQDFVQVAREHGGCDVILDMVGGDYFPRNIEALKPLGRLVYIAAQAGNEVTLNIGKMMQKRITITGSTLRPRAADEKARLIGEAERRFWPAVESGALRPPIDRVFPLDQAAQAHLHLEANTHVGKVLLKM